MSVESGRGGRVPLSEEEYWVAVGSVDWIVRWPREKKKESLSFRGAVTEVFSHGERIRR